MIDPARRAQQRRELAKMSLDDLADYQAFNASDVPVAPREIADAEFLRRQTKAQSDAAVATASAARWAAVAAVASAIAAITAVVPLIWQLIHSQAISGGH